MIFVSLGDLQPLDADFLAVNSRFATADLLRTARANDMNVYVWIVNDATTISTSVSRGVDGVITDRPRLARSVLEQRAQMSVPERLLLELDGLLSVDAEIDEP